MHSRELAFVPSAASYYDDTEYDDEDSGDSYSEVHHLLRDIYG